MAEINRKRQINRATDKYNFWSTIRLLSIEYKRINPPTEFSKWLVEKYGIDIQIVDGMYSSSYIVIDEAKHTFYKLKYG